MHIDSCGICKRTGGLDGIMAMHGDTSAGHLHLIVFGICDACLDDEALVNRRMDELVQDAMANSPCGHRRLVGASHGGAMN